MRPFYAGNPWAHAVYWAAIAVWLLSEASYFVRSVSRAGSRTQDRLSGPALLGGLLLAIWAGSIAAAAVPQAAIAVGRPYLFWAGVTIAVAGMALRWYSIRQLGQFFTMRIMTRADQVVVDKGPYRLVRHPSYTGALMTVLGVLLCSTNWLSLLCFVVAWPGFAYRIRTEEAALAGTLGQPYRDYMRRTKRLIPHLL